jgi:hypothetical protein
MSSILRSEASRRNGAKSRGPVTPEGKQKSLANSARSTGPLTPEGKARSSMNALRYGMLVESIILPNESDEEFLNILARIEAEIHPDGDIERRYVETMALSDWRRLRAICLEREQLAMEIERQQNPDAASLAGSEEAATVEVSPMRCNALALRAIVDQTRAQEYLNRFEGRHDRQYNRALSALFRYRAEKRKEALIKNAETK